MIANKDGYTFAGYYLTFLSSLFTLSTFSYDGENGGTGYLMTLPADRKTYVKEKFLFGILLSGGSWLASCFLAVAALAVREPGRSPQPLILSMVGFLAVFLLLLYAAIPMILKFGPEKGRLGLVGAVGIFILALFMVSQYTGGTAALEALRRSLTRYPAVSAAAASVLYLAAMLFCYRISLRIMMKKEF